MANFMPLIRKELEKLEKPMRTRIKTLLSTSQFLLKLYEV